MADAAFKGRTSKGDRYSEFISGDKGSGAKLLRSSVIEILKSALTTNELAKAYRVSDSTIRKIKTGITWKNEWRNYGIS